MAPKRRQSARVLSQGKYFLFSNISRSDLFSASAEKANKFFCKTRKFYGLKAEYYIRYCDDFVILDSDKRNLENLICSVSDFLKEKLKLSLHADKIEIKKYCEGIDFLGFVILPFHRIVRAKTQRRIFRKLHNRVREYKQGLISEQTLEQSFRSYLGVFAHANTFKIRTKFRNNFCSWKNE